MRSEDGRVRFSATHQSHNLPNRGTSLLLSTPQTHERHLLGISNITAQEPGPCTDRIAECQLPSFLSSRARHMAGMAGGGDGGTLFCLPCSCALLCTSPCSHPRTHQLNHQLCCLESSEAQDVLAGGTGHPGSKCPLGLAWQLSQLIFTLNADNFFLFQSLRDVHVAGATGGRAGEREGAGDRGWVMGNGLWRGGGRALMTRRAAMPGTLSLWRALYGKA